MIYTVNDVTEWIVVGIIVIGFVFAFVWVRDWLSERFGYDHVDRLKKKQ
jgi:hypothetical protein